MDKKIRHCRNSFNIQLKNCGKRNNRGKKQNRCLNTQYIIAHFPGMAQALLVKVAGIKFIWAHIHWKVKGRNAHLL